MASRIGALKASAPGNAESTPVTQLEIVRTTIKNALGVAFALGVASVLLKRRKALGLTGAGLALLATLMGGSEVAVATPVARSNHVGLDRFLLDLFLLSAIFVPIELLWGRVAQPIFRSEWRTDPWHFGVSYLLVQLTVFLTMAPAARFFRWAVAPELQAAVAAQPYPLQFVEVLVVADLTQYSVHRLFHRVPWLWRFHEIHHSSRTMDWLAGSRLHLVDIVVTRGLSFVPLHVLGFAQAPVFAYLLFVSFEAVLIHANVRWRFGPMRWPLATPQHHHWHHAAEPVDVNFAVHLPVIDAVFGTLHLPCGRWPARYGLAGPPVPGGYWGQTILPFRRATRRPECDREPAAT